MFCSRTCASATNWSLRCPINAPARAGMKRWFIPVLADIVLLEIRASRQLNRRKHHAARDVFGHYMIVIERRARPRKSVPTGAAPPDAAWWFAARHHAFRIQGRSEAAAELHRHDAVGAKMTRKRLPFRPPPDGHEDVKRSHINLHLRFHGYGEPWTDLLGGPAATSARRWPVAQSV